MSKKQLVSGLCIIVVCAFAIHFVVAEEQRQNPRAAVVTSVEQWSDAYSVTLKMKNGDDLETVNFAVSGGKFGMNLQSLTFGGTIEKENNRFMIEYNLQKVYLRQSSLGEKQNESRSHVNISSSVTLPEGEEITLLNMQNNKASRTFTIQLDKIASSKKSTG